MIIEKYNTANRFKTGSGYKNPSTHQNKSDCHVRFCKLWLCISITHTHSQSSITGFFVAKTPCIPRIADTLFPFRGHLVPDLKIKSLADPCRAIILSRKQGGLVGDTCANCIGPHRIHQAGAVDASATSCTATAFPPFPNWNYHKLPSCHVLIFGLADRKLNPNWATCLIEPARRG